MCVAKMQKGQRVSEYEGYKLCYIDRWGPFAWFTTADLKDQRGDDWYKKPWDCNAGRPYEWAEYDNCPSYDLLKIAYDGEFTTHPNLAGYHPETWFSAQEINAGHIYWLKTPEYGEIKDTLFAGATVAEFCDFIRRNGGTVYMATTLTP